MPDISLLILIPLAVIALVIVGIFLSYFGTWLKARLNGAPVRIVNLVGMRLGGVPYGLVVSVRITAVKAGIAVSTDKIAAHFLAGGNVLATVQALIAAQKAGITLDWDRACAIDLATKGSGKSVLEAVRTSVDPKVIDCPNPFCGGRGGHAKSRCGGARVMQWGVIALIFLFFLRVIRAVWVEVSPVTIRKPRSERRREKSEAKELARREPPG